MQFSCDSCKAQLQIADEKVRGKRLIVRCKRCGAKIAISDPALAKAQPRVIAPPSPAAAVAASMRAAPSKPAPVASKPAPAAVAKPHPSSDTESTRAMDSDLLEKALQASKSDDPGAVQLQAAAAPAPVQNGVPAPEADGGAVWFAMMHGKQAGPLTHAELQEKTNQGEVGPRTYLWKEGMSAWQRARDLPELAPLFPQLPDVSAPQPAIPPPAALAAPFSTPEFVAKVDPPASKPPVPEAPATPMDGAPEQTSVDSLPLGEQVHQQSMAADLFSNEQSPPHKSAENLALWAREEMEKKSKPAAPKATPQPGRPMFESAAPTSKSRAPLFIVLAVVVAGAVAFWVAFGDKKDEPAKPPEQAQQQPPPADNKPAPPKQEDPAPAENKPPAPVVPAQPAGLTADQVRKKLDEHKAALQTCIDEALRRDPNLRVGKIHIATTIAPSGAVTSAKIDKRTVDESPLGTCLKRATRRIAFPGFSGDAFDVDIPIVVTAGE